MLLIMVPVRALHHFTSWMVVDSGEARGDIGGENSEENWKGRKRGTKSVIGA
jgi:hypothetical protein